MKYRQVIDLIEEIAPTEWFEDEDNSGIQIHTDKDSIDRVLVCLELNDDVIREAIEEKADMIITHHPLIFHPVKTITPDTPVGRYIIQAVQAGIDVYSSHLPFDAAVMGNNMYLAKLLKLQNVAAPDEWEEVQEGDGGCGPVRISFNGGQAVLTHDPDEEGYEYDPDEVGTMGYLPVSMDFQAFKTYVERCLDLPAGYVRCVDGGKSEIRKVAFCTGAGGDYIFTAVSQGCDAYITGDLKLHEAQFAKAAGLTVIDAGHYGTEKIFTENMAAQLRAKAGQSLVVIEAKANTNPYTL